MSKLTSRIAHLKTLLALEEKRAVLQRDMDELLGQITTVRNQLIGGAPAPTSQPGATAAPKASRKGRAKRGALKTQVLAALEAAGAAGVRVTELASSLGTKAANVHAWFHSTGKKLSQIVKVSGGHYRWNGAAPVAAKASAPAKSDAKAAKPAKAGKRGRAKRGALSDKILATLGSANGQGVTIKDLSAKVGAHYRNVAVWFATTGKKNPKIKKVAPATYKLAA